LLLVCSNAFGEEVETVEATPTKGNQKDAAAIMNFFAMLEVRFLGAKKPDQKRSLPIDHYGAIEQYALRLDVRFPLFLSLKIHTYIRSQNKYQGMRTNTNH